MVDLLKATEAREKHRLSVSACLLVSRPGARAGVWSPRRRQPRLT